jgi:hypothetical protein
MAIKSTSKKTLKYVPAYAGNREDSNPLWVSISPLTRSEADEYTQSTRFFQRKGFRGEWESNSVQVQKRQFLENVKEVHNFIDSESSTGDEISDVNRFYNEAPFDLIEEILSVLLDVSQLGGDERKNSQLPSGSVIPEKDGIVKPNVRT